jgi:hypothetical protein
VYVLAGGWGTFSLASVERATLQADGTLSAFSFDRPLPQPFSFSGASAVLVGGTLFAIGAGSSAASLFAATIAEDGSLGPWIPQPTGFGFLNGSAVAVHDRIYVTTGRGGSSVFSAAVTAGAVTAWTLQPSIPGIWGGVTALVQDGHGSLAAIGGTDGMFALPSAVGTTIGPNGDLLGWHSIGRLPVPLAASAVVWHPAALYVLGGTNQAPSTAAFYAVTTYAGP